jgi:diadenosine tetraphosphate (Ap4A) HIT family hydrolase
VDQQLAAEEMGEMVAALKKNVLAISESLNADRYAYVCMCVCACAFAYVCMNVSINNLLSLTHTHIIARCWAR